MVEPFPRKLQLIIDDILNAPSEKDTSEMISQIAKHYERQSKHKLNQKFVSLTTEMEALQESYKKNQDEKIKEKIRLCHIERAIWEKAIQMRKELYSNPRYPLEGNVAEAGAFSVSKRRRKKEADGIIERKGRGSTVIRHYSNMELTVADLQVLLAMNKIWEEKGGGKEIEVSFYEIAKKLNRAKSGKTYEDIKNSLLTLFRTEIKFENFLLNGEKIKTQFIHIMQGVGELESGEKARVRFTDYIYDSLQSGFFIYISMAVMEDLSSSAAQGLYPFVAAQATKGINEWYLNELFTTVNITAPRPSERSQAIINAFEEMKEFEIISDYKVYTDESGADKLQIEPSPILMNSKPLLWISNNP